MNAAAVLVCAGVEKRVGRRIVLRGLDLELRMGELALIRAARGAGKTTLARLLSGQTVPDAGRIRRRDRSAPVVGAAHGFQPGAPALRGLDLRAAAFGLDSGAYIQAVAGFMETPEALRRPFSEIAGRDRALLLYAAAWLAPSFLYVIDGAPLPADAIVRERLWPLFAAARARAAIVWIAEDKAGQGPFAADRFLRLAGGALTAQPPDPAVGAAYDTARRALETQRAALRTARERFRDFERTTKEDLRQRKQATRERERETERRIARLQDRLQTLRAELRNMKGAQDVGK